MPPYACQFVGMTVGVTAEVPAGVTESVTSGEATGGTAAEVSGVTAGEAGDVTAGEAAWGSLDEADAVGTVDGAAVGGALLWCRRLNSATLRLCSS